MDNDKKVASELVQIAKELMATDFPSKEALEHYLRKHPGANKADHKVVRNERYEKNKERLLRRIEDQKKMAPLLEAWKKEKGLR